MRSGIIVFVFLGFCFLPLASKAEEGQVVWSLLSSSEGQLPVPTQVDGQQTASLILDVDRDGFNDFVVSERQGSPSLVWYRNLPSGWDVYVIETEPLAIEAGGHYYDIDGDGDLDVVEGGDSQSDEIWWWENPFPNYDPNTKWTRRLIKQEGTNQHHDLQFADFDGDGTGELFYWNGQPNSKLYFAEIPADPLNSGPWPANLVFQGADSFEGMAVADVNGDGVSDLIAGGRWFEYVSPTQFIEHTIDSAMNFTRAAAGQLVPGGYPEVVFVIGDSKPSQNIDGKGPIRWYEWDGSAWVGNDLLTFDTDHGHSLDVVDFNRDGHLDIFNAEMNLRGNDDAATRIFYGSSDGIFELQEFGYGIDNHESKVGDLDGDGDLDILGKPFSVGVPGVNIWVNERVDPGVLPLDQWVRHSVDPGQPWLSVYALPGDLNGDGRKDIVSGGWWYPSPVTYTGAWERIPIGDGFNNVALAFDFDLDGDLDLLGTDGQSQAPTHPASDTLLWARNDGEGNFTIFDNITPGNGGNPDAAFVQGIVPVQFQQSGQTQIMISWNFGEFGFSGIDLLTVPGDPELTVWPLETVHPFSEGEEIAAADIDSDGDIDLFQGSGWLRNNGSGWERITVTDLIGNNTPYDDPDRVSLSDVDGDGDLDAVIGLLFENSSDPVDLVWLEHPVDPTQEWPLHVIGSGVWGGFSMSVEDMDNDGDPDVVLGEHVGLTRLLIFENNGDATAWTQHVVDDGGSGIDHHDGALTVDFDNDGDWDILSLGWHNQKVWLFENKSVVAPADDLPPTRPRALTASALASFRVELSWEPSSDNVRVAEYEVFRDGALAGKVTFGTTFVDTNATPDTTHEFTVVAVDTSGNRSDPSLPVVVTTPSTETVPPSVPGDFTAHIVSPIRIDLSWSSSTDNRGVIGYLLYLEGIQIASVGTTSYVLSGLDPATSYTVEVAAFDAEGNTSDPAATLQIFDTPPPVTGLWGAWGFESSDSAESLDTSGNMNHGTVENGAQKTPSGYFGSSLDLLGSAGNVNLGPLDVYSSEVTIMAWFYADDFGVVDARLLSKSTSSAAADHIWMLSTIGGPSLRFRLKTDDGTTTTLIGSGDTFSAGQWVHATATYDGSTMRLYQNGVDVGSTAKTGAIALDPGVDAWIGGNPGKPGQVFDGRIDEVKIFGRALNAAEIQTEMSTPVPAISDPEPPTPPQNLAGVATSSSSVLLSWNAATDNAVVAGYRVFQDGSQIATTTQLNYAVTGLSPDTSYAFSVEAFDAAGNVSAPAGPINVLTQSIDTLPPDAPGNFAANIVSAVQIDLSWTAATDNVGVAGYRVFRDGESVAELPPDQTSYSDQGLAADTTYVYELVAVDAEGNTSDPALATLTATTSSVVTDLWGAWGFEEGDGDAVEDTSGNANHGTLVNPADRSLSGGYFGGALETNGSVGHVDLGGLDASTDEITIMAWFYADDFGVVDARLLSKSTSSAAADHIWMLSTIGGPSLRFRLKTDDGTTTTLIGSGDTFSAGEWVHATATYDGSTMRLYQNGVDVGSTAKTGAIALDPGVDAWIGGNPGKPGQVFDGRIDEVKIFGRALNAAEIQTEMNTPVP